MHKIIIQGIECTAEVRLHDTSVTGIRYKLVVTVPKNILPRKRSMMHSIYDVQPKKPSKPKYDLGTWAMDAGNLLGRQLGFKYGWNPSIDKGYNKTTTITFFFNDTQHAAELGYTEDVNAPWVKRHEEDMHSKQCPAFVSPYKRA